GVGWAIHPKEWRYPLSRPGSSSRMRPPAQADPSPLSGGRIWEPIRGVAVTKLARLQVDRSGCVYRFSRWRQQPYVIREPAPDRSLVAWWLPGQPLTLLYG